MHDLETRLDISINFDSPEYSELLSMLEQHGVENTEVLGWEHAIRGMRNPMNSWEKSDSNLYHTSVYFDECNERWETDGHRFMIGPNDLDLMTRLRNAGTDHRKFMRI